MAFFFSLFVKTIRLRIFYILLNRKPYKYIYKGECIMLNWILSPMTRLDWLIVLAVVIGLTWLSTTSVGLRFIWKWSMRSADKAFKHIDWFGEVTDDKEDGLS